MQPFLMFAKKFGLVGADLLLHLAKTGLDHRFAMVDTALRHLPCLGAVVDPASGEQKIGFVQKKDTDTGPVAAFVIGYVGHDAGFSAPNTATPRIRSSARASW